MEGYPEFDMQYLQDASRWGSKPLDNPESPMPTKTGTVDYANTGYVAMCGGFMGNESLNQQHYCYDINSAIEWLTGHGCTRIVNLCN